MAVVNTKSTILTNTESAGTSTEVKNNVQHTGARMRLKTAHVAVAAADDDTSVFRFFRVRSSDSVKSLKVYCDAITGGTDYDLGLYTINGGAAVDADLYADGITLATAAPVATPTADGGDGIECRFGDAATALLSDINNRVWEDLGLTSDPKIEYDVCLTANTIGTAAGVIAIKMEYTAGD